MDPIAQKKIDILLKEYDALRAEIVARISSAFAMWGVAAAIAGAAAVWLATKEVSGRFWVVVSIGAVALIVLAIWNEFATRHCARRIAEIEGRINKLAGEDLLKWESREGAVGGGYLKPFAMLFGWSEKPTKKSVEKIFRSAALLLLATIMRRMAGRSRRRVRRPLPVDPNSGQP